MKKLAFLFPGQGAQSSGMCKQLYTDNSRVREMFQQASDVLGMDLPALVFSGDETELAKPSRCQPAMLVAGCAFFDCFRREYGLDPCYLAGHSLGEITALTCAGAITFPDAVRLVRTRGELMQQSLEEIGVKGGMAALIGYAPGVIERAIERVRARGMQLYIANHNADSQLVVSGEDRALADCLEELQAAAGKAVLLKVSAPFHSPLMHKAAERFGQTLAGYKFTRPEWPVIANINGLPYLPVWAFRDILSAHIHSPVLWKQSIEYLVTERVEIMIEFGPKDVLTKLNKTIAPECAAFSFDHSKDRNELDKILAKLDRKQNREYKVHIPTVITRCLAVAVCTRNSNLDDGEYQHGVIDPYNRIKKIQLELEEQQVEPSLDQMKQALMMLKSVFQTKMTPAEEQGERFRRILAETGSAVYFSEWLQEAGTV